MNFVKWPQEVLTKGMDVPIGTVHQWSDGNSYKKVSKDGWARVNSNTVSEDSHHINQHANDHALFRKQSLERNIKKIQDNISKLKGMKSSPQRLLHIKNQIEDHEDTIRLLSSKLDDHNAKYGLKPAKNSDQKKIEELKAAGMADAKPLAQSKYGSQKDWFEGTLNGKVHQIKMHDKPSEFGINGSKISKIGYKTNTPNDSNKWVSFFDRGFDNSHQHDDEHVKHLSKFVDHIANKDSVDHYPEHNMKHFHEMRSSK